MSDRVVEFLGRGEVWGLLGALIAFASLTWLIRQAPLGQPPRDELDSSPADARARDRAVILAVAGFLLIVLGGYLAVAVGVPAAVPALAFGIALIQWTLRATRATRHASPTARRLHAFAGTALTASLLGGVLLVGNVLAFRLGALPIDLTHDRAFSLSSLTVNQLRSLDRPTRVIACFGNSPDSLRQRDRIRQLLDLMHTANPARLTVEYLDPNNDVRRFEELARELPEVGLVGGNGLVLVFGDGPAAPRAVLGPRDLFELAALPAPGADRFASTFRGEDALTSALIRLREGRRTRVAFTTGHGEPPSSEADPSRPGFGRWRARLASVGADVVDHNLLEADLPASISLLVIAGPKVGLQPVEVARIRAYLERGGPLIVLVDGSAPSGLDEILRIYNVEVGRGVAVDPYDSFEGQPRIPFLPIVPGLLHPITSTLVGQRALIQDAAPLTILGPLADAARKKATERSKRPVAGASESQPTTTATAPAPANPGIVTLPILRTGPNSWVETEPEAGTPAFNADRDERGPVVVGAAAATRPALERDLPVPRVVAFGSPRLAENHWLLADETNLDLLMNTVAWLRGQDDRIGIAPKTHEAVLFARAADVGFRNRLVLVPTLVAFVVIVGLGLATYYARRD